MKPHDYENLNDLQCWHVVNLEVEPHMNFEIRGRVMHSVQSFC